MAEISKQALLVANNVDFPNNNAGAITPAILRSFNTDMIDSTVNQTQYNTNSGSWNISISALNTFTSSQQPQFTNLNAFTASQLTINSGYNATTQSLSASISSTNVALNQVIAWTGSVNAISFNGGAAQYSKRLNFGGFISASFVPNVGGLIADINVLQDNTKLNTSSFNAYTQSQAIDFGNYSASVATSLSSSTYVFNKYTASTNAWTASTNAWTASTQTYINQLLNYSASAGTTFATTGSNTFRGNQIISGTINTTGNIASNGNLYSLGQYNNIYIAQNVELTGSQYPGNTVVVAPELYPNDIYGGFSINNSAAETMVGLVVNSYDGNYPGTPTPMMYASAQYNGSNLVMAFPTNVIDVYKPTTFKAPVITTGSVNGNIVPLTITSNTASMDLSQGNFFTLQLVAGQNTRLQATNITPGQTINLRLNQATSSVGTISFPTYFDFPASNIASASAVTGAVDIMSFLTFDTNRIYSTIIKNLI
jgi:hypothetical protein